MTVTARTYDRLRPDGKTLTSDAKIVIIELWFMLYSRASPYEVRFSVKHPKLGNVVYQWSLPPTVVCHLYFLATRGSGAGLSERSCSALALSLADNFQKQLKQECYCPRPPEGEGQESLFGDEGQLHQSEQDEAGEGELREQQNRAADEEAADPDDGLCGECDRCGGCAAGTCSRL